MTNVDKPLSSHDELDQSTVDSGDHHTRYSDSEAESVVDSKDSGNVLGGNVGDGGAVAIHPNASTGFGKMIVIGDGASSDDGTETGDEVIIGESASGSGVLVGGETNGVGYKTTAMGAFASVTGGKSTAIGASTSVSGEDAIALGYNASASNNEDGYLGVDTGAIGPSNWVVPGDFTVNGSKNFEIPNPARPHTHQLRHGNYEGDVAGGLIYRREVTIKSLTGSETGTETVTMPDWFGPLASDVDVFVQAQGHFGDAYADRVDPTTIEVTANAAGDYKVLIVGTRDDENVDSPAEYAPTRPKGEGWNGEPRAYDRNAPGADPTAHDGVNRIRQHFDHGPDCDPTPCASAFKEWIVEFENGDRITVEDSMDATPADVVDAAKNQR